jgi:hypothetical protein
MQKDDWMHPDNIPDGMVRAEITINQFVVILTLASIGLVSLILAFLHILTK